MPIAPLSPETTRGSSPAGAARIRIPSAETSSEQEAKAKAWLRRSSHAMGLTSPQQSPAIIEARSPPTASGLPAALNRRTVEAVGSGTLHYHQTGRIFRKAVDKNALYRRGERTDPRLNKDVGRPVDPGGTQL